MGERIRVKGPHGESGYMDKDELPEWTEAGWKPDYMGATPADAPTSISTGPFQTAASFLGRGASLGGSGPLSALVGAVTGRDPETAQASNEPFWSRYRKWRGTVENLNERREAAHPTLAQASELAGGFIATLPLLGTGGPVSALTEVARAHPLLTTAGLSGLQAGLTSPADLTQGQIGRTALDVGVGAGLGAATYGLARGLARGGQAFRERHLAKAEEARVRGITQAVGDRLTELARTGGAMGGETANVNRATFGIVKDLLDNATQMGDTEAVGALKEFMRSPVFQEAYRHAISNLPVGAARQAGKLQSARAAFQEALATPIQQYVGNRMPGLAGGNPALRDVGKRAFIRYGAAPIIGATGAMVGGALGTALGGSEEGSRTMGRNVGMVAGGALGLGTLSNVRMLQFLQRNMRTPKVQFEWNRNLAGLATNWLTQHPPQAGVLGGALERAMGGDRLSQGVVDYVLGQTSPEYRMKKKQITEEEEEGPPVMAEVGF